MLIRSVCGGARSVPPHAEIEASAAAAATNPNIGSFNWLGQLFFVEQEAHAVIIAPKISGGRFRYTHLQTEANALRWKLKDWTFRWLIIDLHALEYLGAEVFRIIVALARKTEEIGGRAVLCDATPEIEEALKKRGLDRIWPLYATHAEALSAIEACSSDSG